MISIVVPTMWRFRPFLDFVQELVKVPEVGEVFIVNNNRTVTPIHPVLSHPKVSMYTPESNIYVNPAWNLGARLAKNDKLCIMNDDVIVDLKLFTRMDDWLGTDVGLVGISPGRPEWGQPAFTNGAIDIIPWNQEHTFGFGSLFFVHRDNWINIPPQLKIYYGDNWLFDTQLYVTRKPNWIITNCLFFSPWAQTTKSLTENWLDAESFVYSSICKSIKTA